MGLRQEIKKAIGYTEKNRTCSTCVHSEYVNGDSAYYRCHLVNRVVVLTVSADASCDKHTSNSKEDQDSGKWEEGDRI